MRENRSVISRSLGGGGITMGQQKFLQVRDMFTLNYEGGMHYIKSYKTFDIMQKL